MSDDDSANPPANQDKSYEEISDLLLDERKLDEELQDSLVRLVTEGKLTNNDYYNYLTVALKDYKSFLFELLSYNKAVEAGETPKPLSYEARLLRLCNSNDPQKFKPASLVQIFKTHAHGALEKNAFEALMQSEKVLKDYLARGNGAGLLKNMYTDEVPQGFIRCFSTVAGFVDILASKSEATLSETFKKTQDYIDEQGARTQVFNKRDDDCAEKTAPVFPKFSVLT